MFMKFLLSSDFVHRDDSNSLAARKQIFLFRAMFPGKISTSKIVWVPHKMSQSMRPDHGALPEIKIPVSNANSSAS